MNAISHVCLSGTVNQDQKEKCLQVCSSGMPVSRDSFFLFTDEIFQRGLSFHFIFYIKRPPSKQQQQQQQRIDSFLSRTLSVGRNQRSVFLIFLMSSDLFKQ